MLLLSETCAYTPDIEAVVGIGGVFGPFEQSPLKLNRDLGDRIRRKLDQHLQQVWPQTVLRWLVVDVTWERKRNSRQTMH